jgi:hypothetical protein
MQLSQVMRKFYGILVELLKKEVSHTVRLWGFLVPEQYVFSAVFL